MIRKTNIFLMTVGLGLTVMMTACESQVTDYPQTTAANAFLDVEVRGLNPMTRSAILGDTLPNNSRFGIYLVDTASFEFMEGGFNIETTYKDGKCALSQDVDLSKAANEYVYAFYPYTTSGHPYEMPIEAASQTDYLWGRSIGPNGSLTHVNVKEPKANIQFEHIMALITLRIHRSADNNATYSIPSVSFEGDGNNVFRKAYVNVIDRTIIGKDYSQFEALEGNLSATVLDDNNDLIIADILVIPSKARWNLCVNFSGEKQYFWDAMPEQEYYSGMRYIFDCELQLNGSLIIKKCEIEEWEVTEMPKSEAKII